MDRIDFRYDGALPTNARELLEAYTYGQGDTELILRFAEEYGLSKDNYVWLLTAVLKVNTNLVIQLLQAIAAGEEWTQAMNSFGRESRKAMQALCDQLIGQIEAAGNRNAGQIAVEVSRLEKLVGELRVFNKHFLAASQDFQSAQALFKKVYDAPDQKSAIAALLEQSSKALQPMLADEALAIARSVHRYFVNRALWLHGCAGLLVLVNAVLLWKH